jgi:hypothetical protein
VQCRLIRVAGWWEMVTEIIVAFGCFLVEAPEIEQKIERNETVKFHGSKT